MLENVAISNEIELCNISDIKQRPSEDGLVCSRDDILRSIIAFDMGERIVFSSFLPGFSSAFFFCLFSERCVVF